MDGSFTTYTIAIKGMKSHCIALQSHCIALKYHIITYNIVDSHPLYHTIAYNSISYIMILTWFKMILFLKHKYVHIADQLTLASYLFTLRNRNSFVYGGGFFFYQIPYSNYSIAYHSINPFILIPHSIAQKSHNIALKCHSISLKSHSTA